jgi:hypothetical protein
MDERFSTVSVMGLQYQPASGREAEGEPFSTLFSKNRVHQPLELNRIALPLPLWSWYSSVEEISVQYTSCSSGLYPTMAAASTGPKPATLPVRVQATAVPSTASLQPISMVTFCGSFAQGSVSVPSKLQRPTKAPRTAISGVRQLFCVYATMAMPILHIS